MELGELETEVLRAVRTLGSASPGEVYRAVRQVRNVAYTSVTTTLYRLVDKGLIGARRASEKRVRYRVTRLCLWCSRRVVPPQRGGCVLESQP